MFLIAFHSIFINNLLLSRKKNIILFNSYFSFYFFQNLTNFDIDSFKQPVASVAVLTLGLILSLLNAHNFITRWYTGLIKFCIRIHFNIVQTLAWVKVSFGGQGYAEHRSGG